MEVNKMATMLRNRNITKGTNQNHNRNTRYNSAIKIFWLVSVLASIIILLIVVVDLTKTWNTPYDPTILPTINAVPTPAAPVAVSAPAPVPAPAPRINPTVVNNISDSSQGVVRTSATLPSPDPVPTPGQ
jgi:hypothetical protein